MSGFVSSHSSNSLSSAPQRGPSPASLRNAARLAIDRCRQLALDTEQPGRLTRTFCSGAMHAAHQRLSGWMTAAGMTCQLDAAGNLVGRWERSLKSFATRRALLVGSHLDTVVDAGMYDGPLGVVMGLALVEMLAQARAELPFDIHVIGFCEEEGVRFQHPFLGSLAIIGAFPPELAGARDAQGNALADVLRAFGGDPERIAEARYAPEDVVAFIEPHIEQGPLLELQGLPLGVVTAIAGQTRASVLFQGRAGHAGTVPMPERRDALAAAAHWICEVEQIARESPPLVATVGRIEVQPNVANVIPGAARLRLDVRHEVDAVRQDAAGRMLQSASSSGKSHGIVATVEWVREQPTVTCDPHCVRLLEQAVAESGVRPLRMVSGAGHDAGIMAQAFPVGMLFVRCAGGVSHHPDESVTEDDVAAALDVLWRATLKLAANSPPC